MRQIIAKQDELISLFNLLHGEPLYKISTVTECKLADLDVDIADLKQQLAESNDHQIRMPQINDYPSTDERSYINLDNTGSVNWEKYAKALIDYIKQNFDKWEPIKTE